EDRELLVTSPSFPLTTIELTHPSGNTLPASTDLLAVAAADARFVFRTETFVTGDIGGLAPVTGVAAGDALCSSQAALFGLPGTYKAWLSDATSSPATHFSQSTGPYVNMNGEEVAADWSALTTSGITASVGVSPNGASATTVWTGTNADGTAATANCVDWSSDSNGQNGLYGFATSTTGSQWTSIGALVCNAFGSLVCFEQ
ncbi:MAG: hypothetical protein AAGC67_10165, partial [Myxococcota bacterium]